MWSLEGHSQAGPEAAATQCFLDETHRSVQCGETGQLLLPRLDGGLDRRSVEVVTQCWPALGQTAAGRLLAGFDVQSGEPRKHDWLSTQHRITTELRRAVIEQPTDR